VKNHEIAIGIIDSRIEKLVAIGDDIALHSETSMAVEMAYALGAIDCKEHTRYTQCLMFIYSRNAQHLIEKMRRYG
jgi:hypothetical protein